ncbi:MAG: signal peptidase II [Clostridia bacterium]|nr:signal peptidase II [Clostridia bacterium]
MLFFTALLIDQIVKYFVVKSDLFIPILKGWFNFIYVKNTGGMYGMLENNNMLFISISIIVIIFILLFLFFTRKSSKAQTYLWQLVLAGGVSNLCDRMFRGFVVDYIQLKFFGVFNLADACIVLGIIAILLIEIKEFFKRGNY